MTHTILNHSYIPTHKTDLPKCSIQELQEALENLAKKYIPDLLSSSHIPSNQRTFIKNDCPEWLMSGLLYANEQKFHFLTMNYKARMENAIIDPNSRLYGYHTLPDGVSYLGLIIGDDAASGSCAVLYMGKNGIEMYIPTYGNTVNCDLNCILGDEISFFTTDDIITALLLKYKTNGILTNAFYQMAGITPNDSLIDVEMLGIAYCMQYGYDLYDYPENIDLDENACLTDIAITL